MDIPVFSNSGRDIIIVPLNSYPNKLFSINIFVFKFKGLTSLNFINKSLTIL